MSQKMASLLILLRLNIHAFLFFYSILTWPIRRVTAPIISVVNCLFIKTISTVQKILFLWSTLVILVIVSLLLYAAFYTIYVPAAEISRSVHLAFSVCPSGVGICSFPSANVTFWNDEQKVQEFLGSGQAYSVSLILVMPDSHSNKDIGMLMTVIKMFDKDGNIVSMSQRSVSMSDSTVFQYSSIFMRILDIFLKPLRILGFLEQKKTLIVELFTNFVDDYYHPTVGATIEVQSYVIEVFSATLMLSAKFTGLKYFLYNWPLVSMFCAFWFNLFVLAIGVGVLYLWSETAQRMDDKLKNDNTFLRNRDLTWHHRISSFEKDT